MTSFTMPPPAPDETQMPAWPLWVASIAAMATGGAALAASAGPSVAALPALAVCAAAAFTVVGLVCAWLLSRIPRFRPVQWDVAVLGLAWGGFAAAGYALLANLTIYEYLADRGDATSWSMFAPFTEEPIKNVGILVVLLLAATRPRTALDGLVAGSFVGLGFELVENVVQSLTHAIAAVESGETGMWASLATDVIHEVVRRSWTGHIVITGIAGFGIAYAMVGRASAARRWAMAVGLVLLAFAAHLLWNSPRFGLLYVAAQFGVLAFYLWLIRFGRAREREVYLPYLSWLAAPLADQARDATTKGREARRRRRVVCHLAGAVAEGDVDGAGTLARRVSGPTGS